MKPGEPSALDRTFKIAGISINLKNVWGRPMGFVLLAFVIGATISQGSFAFADDSSTNPFRAIWDAIGELQTTTDSLQAQIDDLRSQRGTTSTAEQVATKTSDGSIAIEVSGGEAGQTIITFFARNSGPDSAVGAKLTAFYETSLLRINFIEGADCSDGSRGIVECYLGTIAEGSDAKVTIDADPISLDQTARIIAEFSSITREANAADNHTEAVFVTATVPVAQPASSTSDESEQETEEQPAAEEQSEEEAGESEEQASEDESEQETEEQADGQTEEEQASEDEAAESGEEQSSEQTGEGASEQSEDSGEATGSQGLARHAQARFHQL